MQMIKHCLAAAAARSGTLLGHDNQNLKIPYKNVWNPLTFEDKFVLLHKIQLE